MGCSSSMSMQLPDAKPLGYSRKCRDEIQIKHNAADTDCNTEMQICDTPINTVEHKPDENIHVNNTRILFISRDSRERDSTDTSGVVPIFNDHEQSKPVNSHSPCLTPCSPLHSPCSGRDSRSMSLPGGIKSVLKTGRNDPRNHMLANQPIKTVTFVEYVTVVTVY